MKKGDTTSEVHMMIRSIASLGRVVAVSALILLFPLPVTSASKQPSVSLYTENGKVVVIVLNETEKNLEFVDTLNFYRDDLPIRVYFLVSSDPSDRSASGERKWIYPERYRQDAFRPASKPVIIGPNSFIKKEWPIEDLIGRYPMCSDNGKCKEFLKFRVSIFTDESYQNSYEVETPWIFYRVTEPVSFKKDHPSEKPH